MKNPRQPIVIAGPTASGKSALALRIADETGSEIINADSLQVYDGWSILTARPSPQDTASHPHHLFGHVALDGAYSVGTWLREVRAVLDRTDGTPIIVGGTGLYLSALINGLSYIPEISAEVRAEADALRLSGNSNALIQYLSAHDPLTLARTDQNNPMRLQRAWEVHRATGKGLAEWQRSKSEPLVDPALARLLVLEAEPDLLNARIERRFDAMLATGALEECARVLQIGWHPERQSSRALGAKELIAHLRGECSLDAARKAAIIATRQYAKRQRTWFRTRMQDWQHLPAGTDDLAARMRPALSPGLHNQAVI